MAQAVRSPASHSRGPDVRPDQPMCDLWFAKWQWDRVFSGFLGFPCQCHSAVAFHWLISVGWDYVSELLPLADILFILQMIYEYGERRWNDTDREKRRTLRKTCPSATLSTTNPTFIEQGANSGLRGERPATNRLSHGTARGSAYSYI
jgi:hypothetical protein